MNFKALIKAYKKSVFSACTWFNSVRLLGQRTSLCRVRSNTQSAWCASMKKSKLFYYQYPWNEWKMCVCFSWFNYFPEGKGGMFGDVCLCEDYVCLLTMFSQCLLALLLFQTCLMQKKNMWGQLQWMGTEDVNPTKGYSTIKVVYCN